VSFINSKHLANGDHRHDFIKITGSRV